jgi:hypothetical protein
MVANGMGAEGVNQNRSGRGIIKRLGEVFLGLLRSNVYCALGEKVRIVVFIS